MMMAAIQPTAASFMTVLLKDADASNNKETGA
jgi:hypothetical protein